MVSDEFSVGINKAPPTASRTDDVGEDLDHLARFRLFEKGETIFKEGARGSEAFVIKSGKVSITQSPDRELGTIGTGQIIGEMAVISDMERIATATALEETVCVALSRRAMKRMMESVDLEMRTIIEFLVDYIRAVTEGEDIDHDEARRNHRILEILLESPDTQTKVALQEPFFQLLCTSLLERAKVDRVTLYDESTEKTG